MKEGQKRTRQIEIERYLLNSFLSDDCKGILITPASSKTAAAAAAAARRGYDDDDGEEEYDVVGQNSEQKDR